MNIVEEKEIINEKWKLIQKQIKISFTPVQMTDPLSFLNEEMYIMFEKITEIVKNKIADGFLKARIIFFHKDLERPISTPFIKSENFQSNFLSALFETLTQSNKEINLNENPMICNILLAKLLQGGNFISERRLKKKGIIIITNNDNLCGIRAILVGKAIVDDNKRLVKEYSKINSIKLTYETKKIANIINFQNNMVFGVKELKNIESYLKDYQISVFNIYGELQFKGDPNKNKFIYICNSENHYDTISNIKIFFSKRFFCHTCKVIII